MAGNAETVCSLWTGSITGSPSHRDVRITLENVQFSSKIVPPDGFLKGVCPVLPPAEIHHEMYSANAPCTYTRYSHVPMVILFRLYDRYQRFLFDDPDTVVQFVSPGFAWQAFRLRAAFKTRRERTAKTPRTPRKRGKMGSIGPYSFPLGVLGVLAVQKPSLMHHWARGQGGDLLGRAFAG
jgi:hypothetical protein